MYNTGSGIIRHDLIVIMVVLHDNPYQFACVTAAIVTNMLMAGACPNIVRVVCTTNSQRALSSLSEYNK